MSRRRLAPRTLVLSVIPTHVCEVMADINRGYFFVEKTLCSSYDKSK